MDSLFFYCQETHIPGDTLADFIAAGCGYEFFTWNFCNFPELFMNIFPFTVSRPLFLPFDTAFARASI